MIDIFIGTRKIPNGNPIDCAWCYIDAATLTCVDGDSEESENLRRLYVEHQGSALFELCRELMALGVPDQPWQSFRPPRLPSMVGNSIYGAGLLTIVELAGSESTRSSIRRAPWAAYPRPGQPICKVCGDGLRMFRGVCLKCLATPGKPAQRQAESVLETRP